MNRVLIVTFFLIARLADAQLQSPGGAGTYINEEDFNYNDFRNFPSKIIDQANYPNPTEFNLHQNYVGHYQMIGTDRKGFPITPKVSPTFNQNFQSPEWWSTHIWNFATSTESNQFFNDKYNIADTLNLAHIGKDWHAAYGSSTHPHPLVFDNRGYGFGLGSYGEGGYADLRGDTSANPPKVWVGPGPTDSVAVFNWNWTQMIAYYDFASDIIVSVGGKESEYLPNNFNLEGSAFVDEEIGTQVERYGDWTATVNWPFNDGSQLSVTSGHGMPIVQCRRSGSNDTINFTSNYFQDIYYDGENALGLHLNKGGRDIYYGIFFPSGTTTRGGPGSGEQIFSHLFNGGQPWANVDTVDGVAVRTGYKGLDGDSLVRYNSAIRMKMPDGMEYFSIALLPDGSQTTLNEFEQRAFAFVLDSRAEHQYDMESAEMHVNFAVETELVPGAPPGSLNETIQALYMHQYKHSDAGESGRTYLSPRGPMQLHLGNSFNVTYSHVGLLPNLGWANTMDSVELYNLCDQVTKMCNLFYDANPYGNNSNSNCPDGFYGETYEHGVMLNKYADLLPICKQVGHETAFRVVLDSMKSNLEDWFDASDALEGGDRYKFFVFSDRVNSMAGYPYGHWTAPNFNDHQLHWGYFVKAAAMIARYDQTWAQEWGPMVEMLIRDANSWMRDDPKFGYMRYFDPYEGHSWISGRAEGRTGLDIESSSESINFATAVALWGANTGQDIIRDWGLYIATVEYQGTQYYWWDKDDDVHGEDYPWRAVGTIWGNSSNFELFFYGSPLMKYGINWLPISGTSMYLGTDTTHMKILWDELEKQEFAATRFGWNFNHNDPSTQYINSSHRMKGWRSLAAMYRAMWDPQWSLDMIDQLESEYQGWELGPGVLPYSKWNDSGAEYDVNTGWGGLSETMLKHFVHTFDSVGAVEPVTSDWAFTHVYLKDGCKHYMAYNPPGAAPKTINFKDGRSFLLEEDTLMVWYPLGEPVATIGVDTNLFCKGESVTVNVIDSTDGGPNPYFEWYINGDTVAFQHKSELTYSDFNDGDTVFAIMFTSLDCYLYETDTSNQLVMKEIDQVMPRIDLLTDQADYCQGELVVFQTEEVFGGQYPVYEWYINNVPLEWDSASFQDHTLMNEDEIVVRMKSDFTCVLDSVVFSDTVKLIVHDTINPSVSIISSQDSICVDEEWVVVAISNTPNVTYSWLLNNVAVGADTTALIIDNPIEGDEVAVSIDLLDLKCATQPSAESNSLSVSFRSANEAFVDIGVVEDTVCEGDSVTFFVSEYSYQGSDPALLWVMNGVVQVVTDSVFSTVDFQNGDSVYVILESNESCLTDLVDTSLVQSAVVRSEVAPVLTIHSLDSVHCMGSSSSFLAQSNKGVVGQLSWYLDGERLPYIDTIIALYELDTTQVLRAASEVESVCLTTDSVLSNELTVTLKDTLSPVLELFAGSTTHCEGDTLLFEANVLFDRDYVLDWYVNDEGLRLDSHQFLSADFSDGDRVMAKVRVIDSSCLRQFEVFSREVIVEMESVNDPFIAVFDSLGEWCENNEFWTYIASLKNSDLSSVQWYVNSNPLMVSEDSLFLTDFSDGDSVWAVAQANTLCFHKASDTSNYVRINVVKAISPTLELKGLQAEYCSLDTLYLTAEVQGADSLQFHWEVNGEIQSATGSSLELVPTLESLEIGVGVNILDACVSRRSIELSPVEIEVLDEPAFDLELVPALDTVCGESVVDFELKIDKEDDYREFDLTWFLNGNQEDTGLQYYFTTQMELGTNEIEVHLSSSHPCWRGKDLLAVSYVESVSSIRWELANQIMVEVGEGEELPLLSDAYSWKWESSRGLDSAAKEQPFLVPTMSEWKYVKMVKGPCEAYDSIEIVLLEPFKVPNAFTPNGDGMNDVFEIIGLEKFEYARIMIYNRWGNLLFDNVGYKTPWDGTFRNKPLPTATYYWIIMTESDVTANYNGFVELIR